MVVDETLLQQIKGFLDPEEGRRLYEIARDAGRWGPCLEIGGYCGKSTVYIGTACKENKQILFSVDHHYGSEEHQPGEPYFDPDLVDPQTGGVDSLREFRKTLRTAQLDDTVVPIVCTSEIAARCWTTPLSMVFIDGGHSHTAVYADYNAWSGHLIPGGYLTIHDIFEDPRQGGQAPYQICQLALNSGLFHTHSRTKSLAVLKRGTSSSFKPSFA